MCDNCIEKLTETEREEDAKENLFMDLLQEGDLLLQRLDASLQVQTSQSGGIHILQQFGESASKLIKTIEYFKLKSTCKVQTVVYLFSGNKNKNASLRGLNDV